MLACGAATMGLTLLAHIEPHNIPRRCPHSTDQGSEGQGSGGGGVGVPVVILVCRLSLSTSALFSSTATRATKMYVRLMSNTIEVPVGGQPAAGAQGKPRLSTIPPRAASSR